jgi:hypothetical protein
LPLSGILCTGFRFCRERSIKRPNNKEPDEEKRENMGTNVFDEKAERKNPLCEK